MTADQALQRARDTLAVREHNARVVIDRAKARAQARLEARELRRRRGKIIEGAARATDSRLPALRLLITGRQWRAVVERSPAGHYDFAPDVRELVLVPINNNWAAMWSDPREQLGL